MLEAERHMIFKKPKVKITSLGNTIVDPAELMDSEKFKRELEEAEELYQTLKEAGHNVQLVRGKQKREQED